MAAWLLGEKAGADVREALDAATLITTSVLTLVECERVLIREERSGGISGESQADRQAVLNEAAALWSVLGVGDKVIARARLPFPVEPVRTLDALHLASALFVRSALRELEILSFDDRLRAAARALGFRVIPAT